MADQPPPPPEQQPQNTVYVERAGSGMAVAALVCGIFGLIIALIPILGIFGIGLGIIAFVLGLIARSKAKKGQASGKGMAVAGAITGALAVVLGIVGLVIVGNAFNQFDEDMQNIDDQFQEDMSELDEQIDELGN